MELAAKYALEQNFNAMDTMLRPFLKSRYSRARAAGIYKIFYLEQISTLAHKMAPAHWENAVKSYLLRFGQDGAIDALCKKYDKDKILHAFSDLKTGGFMDYKAVANIVTGRIVPTNYAKTKA